jgi:hypothetical protein
LASSIKLTNRRNHISAIIETTDKLPMDETLFCESTSSTPRMPSTPIKSPDSGDADVFENEFLRVLAKVHAALER